MLKTPEHQAKIDEIVTRLQTEYAEFDQQRKLLTNLEENRGSLRAASAAAEEEARQHRDELRDLLRETAGKPNRKMQQKAAEQRGAIELSEDYALIAAETDADIKRTLIQMSGPAQRVVELRKILLETFAQCLLVEVIEEIFTRLKVVFDIRLKLENADPFNHRVLAYQGDEKEMVKSDLLDTVSSMIGFTDPPAELPDDLDAVLKATSLGSFKPLSPGQRMKLIRELDSSPITMEKA
ncbi:hypothetical protein ACNQFN_09375 [Thauera butanivorans]|uniref:hypothetical protein n=1 Tax=Thauera butanivorans TaxID=86174 RepID=UPI003AB6B349